MQILFVLPFVQAVMQKYQVKLLVYDIDREAIADDLMERGVPAQDIVLGFHSPSKRKFTEFAVG
jgi:XisI protein